MRTFLLFALAVITCGASACSSSSGDPAPTSDATSDTSAPADAAKDTSKPPTDAAVDAAVDDTATSDDTDGVDAYKPPTDKCTGKTCTGAYMACCPTTGACYDTRCASCCY